MCDTSDLINDFMKNPIFMSDFYRAEYTLHCQRCVVEVMKCLQDMMKSPPSFNKSHPTADAPKTPS
jgi:hypothetical protein